MISDFTDNSSLQGHSFEDNSSQLQEETSGMSIREYYTEKYNIKPLTEDDVEDSGAKYYIRKYMNGRI